MRLSRTLMCFFLIGVIACTDKKDDTPSPTAAGTLNGQPFSAVAEATDTGSGLYISLKDGKGQELTFYVTGTVAGTYPVHDPTDEDFKDQQHSVATIATSAGLFFATDGTVTLSAGADGKTEMQFTLFNSQISGTTSGDIKGLTIQSVPGGQCLLHTVNTRGYDYVYTLFYDFNRKLVKMTFTSPSDTEIRRETIFFIWHDDHIVRDVYLQYDGNTTRLNSQYIQQWSYVDGKISKLEISNSIAKSTRDFTYDLSGRIQKISTTATGYSNSYQFGYDGSGNVVSQMSNDIFNGTSSTWSVLYLNFDQSKNPSALLSAAINTNYFPYALGGNNEYESFTGHTIIPFGKNNYQAAVYSYSNLAVPQFNYKYDLNSSGFPLKMSKIIGSSQNLTQYQITYSGCN